MCWALRGAGGSGGAGRGSEWWGSSPVIRGTKAHSDPKHRSLERSGGWARPLGGRRPCHAACLLQMCKMPGQAAGRGSQGSPQGPHGGNCLGPRQTWGLRELWPPVSGLTAWQQVGSLCPPPTGQQGLPAQGWGSHHRTVQAGRPGPSSMKHVAVPAFSPLPCLAPRHCMRSCPPAQVPGWREPQVPPEQTGLPVILSLTDPAKQTMHVHRPCPGNATVGGSLCRKGSELQPQASPVPSLVLETILTVEQH